MTQAELNLLRFEKEWIRKRKTTEQWTEEYKEGYYDGLCRAIELAGEAQYVK